MTLIWTFHSNFNIIACIEICIISITSLDENYIWRKLAVVTKDTHLLWLKTRHKTKCCNLAKKARWKYPYTRFSIVLSCLLKVILLTRVQCRSKTFATNWYSHKRAQMPIAVSLKSLHRVRNERAVECTSELEEIQNWTATGANGSTGRDIKPTAYAKVPYLSKACKKNSRFDHTIYISMHAG